MPGGTPGGLRCPSLVVHRAAFALAAVLAGCGSSPSGADAPRAEALRSAAERRAAGPSIGRPKEAARPVSDDPPAPESFAAAFQGDVPEGCWGHTVSLAKAWDCHCRLHQFNDQGQMLASTSCGKAFHEQDLRGALVAALVPERRVFRRGDHVPFRLALTNATDASMGIVLRSRRIKVTVTDERGSDVTRRGTCFSGSSGDYGHYLVGLYPRGEAILEFVWPAVSEVSELGPDGRCKLVAEPLPPGKYTVTVHLRLAEPQKLDAGTADPSAEIEIRAPRD
jgi:hypothetical protein